MKGRPWSREEEKELMRLVEAGWDSGFIAGKMGKTLDSVAHKMRRLGLKEGAGSTVAPSPSTTSEIVLPKELPTVEETLRKLAGVLDMVCKGGLSKTEVQRLQVAANVASKYEEILARYQNFCRLEIELATQRKEIDELKARIKKA